MGGIQKARPAQGCLPREKYTRTYKITNMLLNYNKQIHVGCYKNTEHNKHSHMRAPKQITQHQKKKKTFYSTTKSIT